MMAGNEEESTNNINNPIPGAITYGLGGAAVTAIGAAIRGNNIHKEAMTVLVGGVITGAMAGTFGCCLPNTEDSSCSMKIACGALNSGLQLAAFLTAPIMGEQIMDLGISWAPTVVDGLIGDGVILGGVAAIGTVACCSFGGKVVGDAIRHTLWGSHEDTVPNCKAEHNPPVTIDEIAVNQV